MKVDKLGLSMSIKRLAVLSAIHTAQMSHNNSTNNSSSNGTNAVKDPVHGYSISSGRIGRFDNDLHGHVNVLLGGAMIGSVLVVVFLVCYCCHKNIRKNRPHEYSQYWRAEPDVHSLEVFTMDSHAMCYERNAISVPGHHQNVEEFSMMSIPTSLATSLTPRPMTPGPPPAYDSLVFKPYVTSPSDKKLENMSGCILPVPVEPETTAYYHQRHRSNLKEEESRRDDEGLPSYEAALKLEAHGYV